MHVNKVLIVDDSATDLALIQAIVDSAGYTVLTATSGAEAVDKAVTDIPDLIFLDIAMPEMDGYAACRAIQKIDATKKIPIVFVSGKGQDSDRIWAQMQGGKGYITKPYSPVEVVEQLNAFS